MQNQHSEFLLQCAYSYFPEDTNCIVLFREMASIEYWNLIKVIRALFEENLHFALRDPP
jgi:hypothetical protein